MIHKMIQYVHFKSFYTPRNGSHGQFRKQLHNYDCARLCHTPFLNVQRRPPRLSTDCRLTVDYLKCWASQVQSFLSTFVLPWPKKHLLDHKWSHYHSISLNITHIIASRRRLNKLRIVEVIIPFQIHIHPASNVPTEATSCEIDAVLQMLSGCPQPEIATIIVFLMFFSDFAAFTSEDLWHMRHSMSMKELLCHNVK